MIEPKPATTLLIVTTLGLVFQADALTFGFVNETILTPLPAISDQTAWAQSLAAPFAVPVSGVVFAAASGPAWRASRTLPAVALRGN